MQKYKNKNVNIVRDAQQGDKNYDSRQKNQVLIQYEDGKTEVVSRDDVEAEQPGQSQGQKSKDSKPLKDKEIEWLQNLSNSLKQSDGRATSLNPIADSVDKRIRDLSTDKV